MKIDYKQLFLDHHLASLDIEEFNDGYDFEMSEEYTADGYSLYLCKYHFESTILNENVYYYTHELAELLKEMIEEGLNIYCSDSIFDECYIEDEWVQWCEDAKLIEWNDDDEEYEITNEDDTN